MHEYTAAFRVAGGQLIIEDVTRTLQIQPTHVIHLGQKQQGGPAKKAVWSFEQVSPTGGQWHSLEDALLTLVSDLRQRHEEIRALQAKFDVCLWCGHFTSSFDGGPRFSSNLLRVLGDFGVDLFLDTYCSAPSA